MALLFPTMCCNKVTNINIKILKELFIKTVLLDVDNTIAKPDEMELFDGAMDWINSLKKENIKVVLISNNKYRRIKPIAELLNIDFLFHARKPLPFKLIKFFSPNKSTTILIGDQIFTDILCANLAGIKSILVEPDEQNEEAGIKFKRLLEKPIKKKIKAGTFALS